MRRNSGLSWGWGARVTALLAILAPGAAAADMHGRPSLSPGPSVVVIDTRPLDECAARSVGTDARCLPPSEVFGPHDRLIEPRLLLWRLGTLGLDGSETVQVVGDDATTRDAIAALLHVAGQARVIIVAAPVSDLPPGPPGRVPAPLRDTVYTATMRDDAVIYGHEVAALLAAGTAPPVVDGRPEAEYWGAHLRAPRGGHLPGAQSLPRDRLIAARGQPVPDRVVPASDSPLIAYGHGPRDGLAFLTALVVQGVDARLYAGGWSEWAATARPAAAATYPQTIVSVHPGD